MKGKERNWSEQERAGKLEGRVDRLVGGWVGG